MHAKLLTASQIGITVDRVPVVPDLDLKAQVKAVVDTDRRLFFLIFIDMTCNDTGYVAIEFDPQTHFPKITDVRIIPNSYKNV